MLIVLRAATVHLTIFVSLPRAWEKLFLIVFPLVLPTSWTLFLFVYHWSPVPLRGCVFHWSSVPLRGNLVHFPLDHLPPLFDPPHPGLSESADAL